MGRPRAPLEGRFWAKVDKTGACWLWTAGTNDGGYGRFRDTAAGRTMGAHRKAYELSSGEAIPSGVMVLHRCDNPPCVNPGHLFLGSHAENMADRQRKCRQAKGPAFAAATAATRARGDRSGARSHPETLARGERHGRSKLTDREVVGARFAWVMADASFQALANAIGVHRSTVARAVKGQAWRLLSIARTAQRRAA